MTTAQRKIALIVGIMILALAAFISIIHYSRSLAETESEATVYSTQK